MPAPIPVSGGIEGVEFSLLVVLCEAPGVTEGDSWDCGIPSLGERVPGLRFGNDDCRRPTPGNRLRDQRFFDYQFQGGSLVNASLRLPHGTGVPVGPGTGFHYVVLISHMVYPSDSGSRSEGASNHTTPTTGIEVSFSRRSQSADVSTGRIHVNSLKLVAGGLLRPHRVSRVTGSWIMRDVDEISILFLYTHWREAAIDIQVWIEKSLDGDGRKWTESLLHQDPRTFLGVTDLSLDSNTTSIQVGDRLTIQCTFNNTEDRVVLVE